MKAETFERGIHPAYNKELSLGSVVDLALPTRVIIPLHQHIGAPSTPVVKKGDDVTEGQLIGDGTSFVSAPVHASISGKVKDIVMHPYPAGGSALSIIIEGDGVTRKDWGSVAGALDLGSMTVEELRSKIRAAGIVGMGGAAFPTSVKLSPPPEKKIDTVVLNGCECEPFLTSDHRIMVDTPLKVVWGLKAIMRAVGASKGVIGVEDNKTDAIEALSKAAKEISSDITITALETKYPQGAEKMLIHAVLKRKVPLGKLPMDAGVVVNNVGTAAAIFDALKTGKPLIERIVTVSGNGINKPGNFRVRVGTPFEEVIEAAGGIKDGDEVVVINGGPMMGIAQRTLDAPVVKGTSGITILQAKTVKPLSYKPCIKCASCVEACPMGLMPYKLADMGRLEMAELFKEWSGTACIECGCCSFVCPSKRPLVEWIRVGKIKLREAERKKSA
ncbi:MAG: electron transport complex subunit RsxC [Deltaproteobacteria bacterium]|nr:electron transport complex subunit RsxC [Deltaproteobacteria bacterium]